jgi:nicotinamide riboside transporter PnuC
MESILTLVVYAQTSAYYFLSINEFLESIYNYPQNIQNTMIQWIITHPTQFIIYEIFVGTLNIGEKYALQTKKREAWYATIIQASLFIPIAIVYSWNLLIILQFYRFGCAGYGLKTWDTQNKQDTKTFKKIMGIVTFCVLGIALWFQWSQWFLFLTSMAFIVGNYTMTLKHQKAWAFILVGHLCMVYISVQAHSIPYVIIQGLCAFIALYSLTTFKKEPKQSKPILQSASA